MAEQIKSLKTGDKYKDTPIGKIPVDWEVVQLKNIVEYFYNGGTPDTKNKSYWDGNIPWITGADFEDQKIKNIRRHITDEGLKGSSTNLVPKDDLLVVTRTGVGKAAIAPFDVAISQDITGIILDSKQVSPVYLYWYFNHNATRLRTIIQGTSISGLLRDDLESFYVTLPPLAEQKKIADILSIVDEEIEKTDQIIEKTKEAKKGLMQRLLTRGIGHKKFKKTQIGEIPAKWNIESLIEILVLQRGFDLPVQHRIKGKYPILASNGVIDYHQKFKVKGPGIAIGRSGTLGKVHYIESNYWPLNTALYVKEFYNNQPKFIYYFLQSLSTEKYGTGTGVPTLNRNILHKIKVAIPPLEEQIKIAEIISESDAEIEKEFNYRTELERMKTGLMQVLLTGRIRVNA